MPFSSRSSFHELMFGAPLPLPVIGFLAVHHALRSEVRTIAVLVAEGRMRAARRRSRLVARVLANHHRVEDELLWPALVGHAQELEAVVERLERDHDTLDRLLTRLPHGLDRIAHVARALDEHLDAEERHAVPVWVAALSAPEHEQFATALRRRTGWRDAGVMIAWLIDHAPPGAEDLALPHVPKAYRIAHRVWWRHRYHWQWGRATGYGAVATA